MSMSAKTSLLIFAILRFFILLLFLTFASSYCIPSSSYGNIYDIHYPFQLNTDPNSCTYWFSPSPYLDTGCYNNRSAVMLRFGCYYYVEKINYAKKTIRVVDPGILRGNLSSCPLNSFNVDDYYESIMLYYGDDREKLVNTPIAFIHCLSPVNSAKYVKASFCGSNRTHIFPNSSHVYRYSYVIVGKMLLWELESSCTVDKVTWGPNWDNISLNPSLETIYDALAFGFQLEWSGFDDGIRWWQYIIIFFEVIGGNIYNVFTHGSFSSRDWTNWISFAIILFACLMVLKFVIGFALLICLVVCKWRKRHLSMDKNIEDFLQGQQNLAPIQYTYSEIKKMTNNFAEKLGEGGCGIVYKGKLRSGPYAAVKTMAQSMASEEEFMNEVGSIGQIHHVNVVQLIGFCVERLKYALVYEFLPNGSLDRYIFNQESLGVAALTYDKMFEIAVGVARGINYLHHGCKVQILHFDIKPHNILLDENFNPKISDFGLARLHATNESFINLTGARGTMGYMAPEMFYKNMGRISHKADVYSFGMLLMEIAARRKNMNPLVEDISQICFPSWVYDQLFAGNDIDVKDATEEERKVVKKIIIVALWCIQMRPSDRPAINKVVEMLEAEIEPRLPSKPFIAPHEMAANDHGLTRTYSVDYVSVHN